jgi:hypothetical protein
MKKMKHPLMCEAYMNMTTPSAELQYEDHSTVIRTEQLQPPPIKLINPIITYEKLNDCPQHLQDALLAEGTPRVLNQSPI